MYIEYKNLNIPKRKYNRVRGQHKDSVFREWRKSRQPEAGAAAIEMP